MDLHPGKLRALGLQHPLPGVLAERLERPVEALGFWGAIALPVAYLSLLASGIDGRAGLGLFLGLVGLHVAALVIGHGHARSGGERAATRSD